MALVMNTTQPVVTQKGLKGRLIIAIVTKYMGD